MDVGFHGTSTIQGGVIRTVPTFSVVQPRLMLCSFFGTLHRERDGSFGCDEAPPLPLYGSWSLKQALNKVDKSRSTNPVS